jgi:hypothetical protein
MSILLYNYKELITECISEVEQIEAKSITARKRADEERRRRKRFLWLESQQKLK